MDSEIREELINRLKYALALTEETDNEPEIKIVLCALLGCLLCKREKALALFVAPFIKSEIQRLKDEMD